MRRVGKIVSLTFRYIRATYLVLKACKELVRIRVRELSAFEIPHRSIVELI